MPQDLRPILRKFLKLDSTADSLQIEQVSSSKFEGFTRELIRYRTRDLDTVPAYLFVPDGAGPFPGIVVFHQHAGQRHFGKSEVAGLVGDPWQAFGPALAKEGFIVLAPDSICFEDRRAGQVGTEESEEDWLQHFNVMTSRILRGDSLMTKVLNDSSTALSVVESHPQVKEGSLGILGHSYGGNIVLFLCAVDERVSYACSSGAACSYRHKFANQTGIEFAMVIPGFSQQFDVEDLVKAAAPRRLMLVSATEDIYSMDAEDIVSQSSSAYEESSFPNHLEHNRFDGGHALDADRFSFIVEWTRKINLNGVT